MVFGGSGLLSLLTRLLHLLHLRRPSLQSRIREHLPICWNLCADPGGYGSSFVIINARSPANKTFLLNNLFTSWGLDLMLVCCSILGTYPSSLFVLQLIPDHWQRWGVWTSSAENSQLTLFPESNKDFIQDFTDLLASVTVDYDPKQTCFFLKLSLWVKRCVFTSPLVIDLLHKKTKQNKIASIKSPPSFSLLDPAPSSTCTFLCKNFEQVSL